MLCGVTPIGIGTFTTEGITALCKGLKQSKVSSLRCVSQLLSMCDIGPCHTPETARRAHSHPLAHSLANNYLGYGGDMSGVKALAAALKDSQITSLE
jgi:hypothetical protein